ncbi:hypothetical protein NP493_545g01110 [Ridgeia piscesae]|uniref:Uncharacterized protein n=1 Tax=Ridgeia piscesae TaxID=27915 RepID=A0AAD9NRZ2_RIDPI|nr:hypothetical protein NP493_545g01110 [Ridgeia piscesae]
MMGNFTQTTDTGREILCP